MLIGLTMVFDVISEIITIVKMKIPTITATIIIVLFVIRLFKLFVSFFNDESGTK